MRAFQHPEAERAFLLQYQGPTVPYVLASAVVSLLVALFKAASGAVFQTAYVLDGQLWWRIAAAAYMPLLYVILGQERYILYFGATGLWIRLVFATGWMTGPRPGSCAYPHCALLWHHRLLVIHAASVMHRIQSGWYWLGGICSWLVAAVVEVADPDYACPASLSCLIAGLQASAATPAALLHAVLQAALRSSRVAAVDIVLPGLLLAWLELRARKAWCQRQQQQHVSATSTADAAAPAAGCDAQHSMVEGGLKHRLEEQYRNKQLAPGSCSCNTAHTAADVVTDPPNQQQKDNSRAPAECCCMQHAKQPLSTTGDAASPSPADCDKIHASAEAGEEASPRQQTKPVARSPAGSSGVLADSSAKQHTSLDTAAASQDTASAGMQDSPAASAAATDSTSLLSGTAAQEHGPQATATSPVNSNTAIRTVSSSSTEQVLPALMLAGAAPALAPAAPAAHTVGLTAAGAVPLQQQAKLKRVSALYVSPLESVVASFKFNEYPGKGLVAIKRFQHQLAAAVEEAAMAAAAGRAPQTLAGPGPAVAAWVTSTAAFPGCFQVVMHLALPKGQLYGSPEHAQQQLLQRIKCAAEHVVDTWPDCKGLIDVQLKLLQDQQQPPAVEAVAQAAPTVEGAGTGAANPTYVLPSSMLGGSPANHGSSYGLNVLPVAVVARSLDTAAATMLQVELFIPAGVVEQLSAAGQHSMRVVVASQLPAGGVLVDKTYKLPDLLKKQSPAAELGPDPAEGLCETPHPGANNAASAATETAAKETATLQVDRAYQLPAAQRKQIPAASSAAGGEAAECMATTSNSAERAAAETATAEAAGDWHLQLQIPWNPSSHLVLQQLQVLTSIVLAGHIDKHNSATSLGNNSAATAAAVSSKHSQASPDARADAAADAASLHGVIAELPLSVLPEGPASELQKLFEATVADGSSANEAYAEMLPLLRDMAAALCIATGSSYADSSYVNITGQQDVPPVLLEALSVFFVQHDMQNCEQLLDAVNSCQQIGTRMTGGVGLHGTGGDDDSSKGGSGKGGSKISDSAGGRTDDVSALNSSDGSTHSSNAPSKGSVGCSSSSCTGKATECRERASAVRDSCTSMPSDKTSSQSSPTSRGTNGEVQSDSSRSAKTCDEEAAPARKAAASFEAWDAPGLEHALQSPGALRISLTTVLFGFPSAAVEAAYVKYRAARLHLLDLVLVATGPAAVIVPVVQLLLLLWGGFAGGGGSYDVDRILALTLRTVGVATHWFAHAVVWGAGSGFRVLQPLHQWRSAVLLAGIGFVMSVTVAFKMRGGAWARATRDVLQDFRGTFLGFCLHRDLVYSLFACTEILPYNIIFVGMQFILFDGLFERPAVPGFGRIGSVVFLVSMHQAIAITVESSLRKTFVRHVQAASYNMT